MKIELHAHHLTPKMYDIDDDPRAPYWKGQEMMVGSWVMRQKKFPESQQITAEDPGTKLFERMDHPFRREMMAKFGVDVLVVSNTPLTYYYWAEEFGVRYATLVNDELAAWCDEDPSTFLWWAQVPMHEPTAAAKELERAVGLGAVGFMSGGAEMGGRNLHDPEMDELWAKAVELNVPMFIHGQPLAVAWQDPSIADPFDTTIALGYMYDETRAFWHLVLGGVLDRFPNLRVYITHAGGYVPYQIERIAMLDQTLAPDAVNERPPLEYLRNFWFDPMIPNDGMRRAFVDLVGIDRVVYGSNMGGSDQITFDLTDRIGLSEAEREQITSKNAIELLNLGGRVNLGQKAEAHVSQR
jgi:aminocarboxymuconate-semialdehyde decarboxylase